MQSCKLLAVAALAASSVLPASAATRLVPQQYPTIQAAVNAAAAGDIVLVSRKPKGAVYNEAVTVSKPIILQGSGSPVIDGTGLGTPDPIFSSFDDYPNAIEIRSSNVAVRGFVIQNSGGAAVNAGSVSADGQTDYGYGNLEVSGCTLLNNASGITLSGYVGQSIYYGGGGTVLKGFSVLNDTVTGSGSGGFAPSLTTQPGVGISVSGNSVQMTGNHLDNNDGDGVDASGSGLLISGNEAGGNAGYGLNIQTSVYNPAAGAAAHPCPAPTVVSLNAAHDNMEGGMFLSGTQAVTGNTINHNADYGLQLDAVDYSVIAGNLVTGTTATYTPYGYVNDPGTGIYVQSSGSQYVLFSGFTAGGPLILSSNIVTGNAANGIGLDEADDVSVLGNTVNANGTIGIHVSDFVYEQETLPPNTISYNVALKNTLYDAQDDTSAPDFDDLPTTPNIWTKNLFGKTNPPGLSH